MAYTPAPPIDLSKLNFGQFNPNLQQTATPAPVAAPYSGTTSGYQPSIPPPAYNGTTSNYKPNTPAPPQQTAAPKPQPQGTPTQSQKVPGGWMTADGQFVPVPNMGGTPAPARPQEPPNYQFQPHTPAPPQMQQPTAAPVYKDPYARTPESIAAIAKERIQKIQQAGKTAAGGALTGAKNAYDYTNQIEGDTRTLRNAQFKETSNPFSGNTGYQAANMQRNDSIQDTAQDKDYNAQVGLINQKLADLEAAAPGDEQAIIDQLQQIERQTGIDVAQLQEQQRQNQFNNNMQTNQFNRGVYESDRGFNYGVGRDQRSDQVVDRAFDYGVGRDNKNDALNAGNTAYDRSQDTIANNRNAANDEAQMTGNYTNPATKAAMDKMSQNSAAWFNATPEERARLSAENQRLGASIGATQDANGDWTTPQPQQTIAARQLERGNFESDRSYELAKSSQEWNQLLQKSTFDLNKAQTIWENNFKDKSFSQSMNEAAASRGLQWANLDQRDREFVADQAYKEKSFSADQTQRGIDNKYRESQSKTTSVDPKTSTDNHGLLSQDIDEAKDAAEANALIEANRNSLTDADYKDLKKKVIDQF